MGGYLASFKTGDFMQCLSKLLVAILLEWPWQWLRLDLYLMNSTEELPAR
jgi:hypothetical protein